MTRTSKWIVGGAVFLAATGASAGVALGAGGTADDTDPPDQQLTGTDLDRASEAALAETGGGTVVDSEAGDDGAAYSVEIRRDDGTEVEVDLDQDFAVTGQETDDDNEPDDDDGPDDD
ncbi:MAG TPA: PepSY domain-containing protein [Actinomycetales bacterium]|nr:PepSY domain-containing protein [Actinomycetales bacterium]